MKIIKENANNSCAAKFTVVLNINSFSYVILKHQRNKHSSCESGLKAIQAQNHPDPATSPFQTKLTAVPQ